MTAIIVSATGATGGFVMVPGLHTGQAITLGNTTTSTTLAGPSGSPASSSSSKLNGSGTKLKHTPGTQSRRAIPYVDLSRRRLSTKPPPPPTQSSRCYSSPGSSSTLVPIPAAALPNRPASRNKTRPLFRVPPTPPPLPEGDVPMYLLNPVQPYNTFPRKRIQKPDFDGPPTLSELKKEGIPLRPDRSAEEPFSAVHGEPTWWLPYAENSSSIFPLSEPCRAESSFGRARQVQREDEAKETAQSRRVTKTMVVQPRKRQMPVLYSHAVDAPAIIASQAAKRKLEGKVDIPGPSKLSRFSVTANEIDRASRRFAETRTSSTIGYDTLRLRLQFERAGVVRDVKEPGIVEAANQLPVHNEIERS